MPRSFLLAILIAALLPASVAFAQGPKLPAVMVSEPPKLDGDLSDSCWQEAPSASDFYVTTDGSEPAEPTKAWICYDKDNIYAAFYCKDSQPTRIVAQQKKRGGDVNSDDWVAVTIDCYRNYVGCVWFKATPRGVQTELLPAGDVSKIEWRGDWRAASKIVADGYTVEMAIPFSILKYNPAQTSMGISLNRYHARSIQQSRAPDCSPDLDPRKFYVWDGLKLPTVKNRPLVMGYSLYGAGGDDPPRRAGLDIKHSLTPTMTGLLTVNPDFRNVEQQVESIDFTYTERYLSDSRPFFQESQDFFPDSEIFYPRRIREIDLGAKAAGTIGNYSVGFLHARNFGDEDHTVIQAIHRWPARGAFGVAGVRSSVSGRESLSSMLTGYYRLYDRNDHRIEFSTDYFTADSSTGSGTGSKLHTSLSKSGPPRTLEWNISHNVIDSDFDPYLGYVPEKGINNWSISTSFGDEPTSGKLRDWGIDLSASTADYQDGSLYYRNAYFGADCEWANGRSAWFDVSTSRRPPHGEPRPTYNDRTMGMGIDWNRNDLYKSGYLNAAFGKLAGGSYLAYSVGQGWNIGDNLSMQLGYEYSRIKEPSPEAFSANQLIATVAYDLDTERTVSGRLVSEEGNSNFYLAYRQRVRTGLDAYLIFGDPNAEKTRSSILLKLISLL